MFPSWRLGGEYLENCNCEVLCPCIVGPRSADDAALARPTEGYCDVPVVFHVGAGAFGDVRLDGLAVALAIHTPGPMGAGNWTLGLYLDERGDSAQGGALEAIFGGAAGGPLGRVTALVTARRPTRVVPIRFEKDGRRRRAVIPDILDLEVEGLQGADGHGEVWLDNVRHFAARRLAVARATRSRYRDHSEGWGLSWDHTGRNGHPPFDWSGP